MIDLSARTNDEGTETMKERVTIKGSTCEFCGNGSFLCDCCEGCIFPFSGHCENCDSCECHGCDGEFE